MKQRLKELLNELHAELGGADSLDETSKQQLRDMADEIDAKIDARVEAAEATVTDAESQLQTAVLEFETDHPRIAGILGQIADTLSKLGI